MLSKNLLRIGLALALVNRALGQDVDLPEVKDARVTIPYGELKELWKAAQQTNRPAPAKPPVPAELTSARFEVELREGRVLGAVEFEAQSFSDEWNALPLITSDLQVHKIEPADANVVLRDGTYAWLTNHPTKQRLKMFFAAPLVQEGDGLRWRMPSASALVNVLSIKGVPPTNALRVANAIEISNDKGLATYRIAPRETVDVRLVSTATAKPTASQWETEAQCFVSFADDTLHYETHVAANAINGSAINLNLNLPGNARIVSVSGDDLASWHADGTAVALQWRTIGIAARKIDIVYDIPQREGEWSLVAPENENGKTVPPTFAVTAPNGIELNAEAGLSAAQAPRWLAERCLTVTNALVTRADKVTAKLLPVVDLTPAIIEKAACNTRIVRDGSSINEQIFFVRTRAPLSWKIELPNESELLSCTVDDRRTSPTDRGHAELEIPILPNDGDKPTRIALAYTGRTAAFQPVSGRVKVELPKTPLLIHSLTWDLAIPADYDVAAFEGNLAPISGAPAREGSTVVRLSKELCRNERPAIELFYQKPEVKK